MTAGLCVCIVLGVLCNSCLGRPHSSSSLQEVRQGLSPPSEAHLKTNGHFDPEPRLRHSRSDPLTNTIPYAGEDEDPRANLSELLARLISSRKGSGSSPSGLFTSVDNFCGDFCQSFIKAQSSIRRNSTVNSRASGLNVNHRIKDRDYTGWMDFGRRSAEEYEYSS